MENSNQSILRILYVGNNDEFFGELRQHKKFSVEQRENGLKAMDFLNKEGTVDAVISDVRLPGINGHELAKLIKGKKEFLKIPFIMVSSEKNDKEKQEIFKIKGIVDDYYELRVDNDDLESRILFLKYYLTELSEKSIESELRQEYKIPLIKRLFDILVSATALFILSPLLIIAAIAIRLESKGPLIYKSRRVGTGYGIFDFLKFRSMYTGADAKLKELRHMNQYANSKVEETKKDVEFPPCPRCSKLSEKQYCSPLLYIGGQKICEYWFKKLKKKDNFTFIKIKDDPRITKVGKIIRNTSIDELPQLINVLKGDMSIVGNRPLPLYEAELLTSDDWSARFLGPAGITGLWQVELRGKGGVMSEEERKRLDNYYAQNYSFWEDIKLILRTIPALFQKENV